jgi:hypothetical protein
MESAHLHHTRGQMGLEVADYAVQDLDARQRRILIERLAADEPATLESLGAAFGISRERIRQIEKAIKLEIQGYSWFGLCRASVGRDEWLLHIEQLEKLLPAWFTPTEIGTAPEPYMPTPFQLLRAAGVLQVTRGVWVTCEIEDGPDGDPSIPDDLGDDIASGLVTQRDAEERLVALGLDPSYLSQWFDDHGFYVRHGRVRPSSETLEEFLVAELRELGYPASKDRIAKWVDGYWSAKSDFNLVQNDSRFTRVDTDLYALAEWNLRGYSSIRDSIADLIAEHGPMPVDQVVETITAWYDVESGSVRQYAGAAPFRIRDGVVAFAGESTALARGIPPTIDDLTQERQRRHWFRTPDGYSFRIHINDDHLRGSGWPTSLMAAVVAGVADGSEWSMDFTDCPGRCKITRRFGQQANFGSIRPGLMALGAQLGDIAFIDFVGEPGEVAVVDLRVIPAGAMPSDPFDLALTLVGADRNSVDPQRVVEQALEVESAGFAGELVTVAKARNDQALADALSRWAQM